ncbi:SAM-dependent methyltransferase [Xanthomonas sacchari]|uniref:methyltransferase domain-containing protein n=1 Tax=Xanthomonas sacchari TaxID=56458 RepID=UPI00278681F9|nr:methyltransferase domain-containing protein [Xanthomonas sacchari]MDQ1094683.1 SAM-dependent methyltransferase [Xanthomonas sacchari]
MTTQPKNVVTSPPVLLEMSVGEVLRKINAVVLRRTATGVTGVDSLLWPENFEIWTAAAPATPPREVYDLPDLLSQDDADFVSNAYRVLLRRAPDSAGFLGNIEALRQGVQTKLEVIASLRFSPEGMAVGVPVRGLRLAWLLHRWKRKPLVGPLLSWGHELLCLGRRGRQMEWLEVRGAREIHRLGRHVNQIVLEAGSRLEAVEHELSASREARKALEALVQSQVAPLLEVASSLRDLSSSLERDRATLSRLEAREIRLVEEEARRAAFAPQLDALYSSFEDRFRGPEWLIQARARPYLQLVRDCGAGTLEAPVVDVGCGRGEWLALLRDEGLHARGVDLNSRFVNDATERGMEVIEGDAIEVLRAMPAGSVGAVTSMHLVEHLPFDRVVEFIDACHHVLRPGGVLILETPNPENLDVATIYFYMDPTHRNPLPPEMLRWVVEARGYPDAKIERLSEERDLSAPALLPDALPGSSSINSLLARTHAAPDYAIVAHRGEVSNE